MKTSWLVTTVMAPLACGPAVTLDDEGGDGTTAGPGDDDHAAPTTMAPTTTPADDTSADASGDGTTTSPVEGTSSDGGSDTAPPTDTGPTGDPFCDGLDAGIYCSDDGVATECDERGFVTDETACLPGVCLDAVGCVACVAGQVDCSGPHVMTCDAKASPPTWQVAETCDPAANMACDLASESCASVMPIGGVEPTGTYYGYADFPTSGVFQGGYDVDSFEDRLYINRGAAIDVYQVELLDSDGDGVLEPNQHPSNPDATGPIEERTLTFVESISWPTNNAQSVSELYVNDTAIFVGGFNIEERLFVGGVTSVIATPPTWLSGNFSQLGYDELRSAWYASNEATRRVYEQDPASEQWGIAFEFPSLSGDHMDGLEIVRQPDTGIEYVYVSDMTSDFLAQYRFDENLGWVQENLFEGEGVTAGSLVEGMGFGALDHFWMTSGQSVYEIGGGAIAPFTEASP